MLWLKCSFFCYSVIWLANRQWPDTDVILKAKQEKHSTPSASEENIMSMWQLCCRQVIDGDADEQRPWVHKLWRPSLKARFHSSYQWIIHFHFIFYSPVLNHSYSIFAWKIFWNLNFCFSSFPSFYLYIFLLQAGGKFCPPHLRKDYGRAESHEYTLVSRFCFQKAL